MTSSTCAGSAAPEVETLQVVVMGVSGTGKSTVGVALAEGLDWEFIEGDDLHPRSNVEKMESGEPLTDADRAPWLERIRQRAADEAAAGRSTVIACSALKRSYRDALRAGVGPMFFLHLAGSQEVLEPRMARRERHFMPTGLLRSQLETLEPLEADEDGAAVDVSGTPEQVIDEAQEAVAARLRSEDPCGKVSVEGQRTPVLRNADDGGMPWKPSTRPTGPPPCC